MIPYDFTITSGEQQAAGATLGSYRRRRGLRDNYDLDLAGDPSCRLDRRLALSLAVALDVLQNR